MQHLISLFFGTSALLSSATHALDGFSNSDKRKKEDFLFNTRDLKEVALSTRSLFQNSFDWRGSHGQTFSNLFTGR